MTSPQAPGQQYTTALPVPDPTIATNDAMDKAIEALRGYLDSQLSVRDERLSGIDRATTLRIEEVAKLPATIEAAIAHHRAVVEEKFASVAQQFKERDTRSERESRDNKVAVDAAFAAQKEAAAKQDEGNQKAIDKSEKATNETIAKDRDAGEARARAQDDKIDDLKERVIGLENRIIGAGARTVEQRAGAQAIYAAVGFGISLLLAAIVVMAFLAARK